MHEAELGPPPRLIGTSVSYRVHVPGSNVAIGGELVAEIVECGEFD